VIVKHVRKDHLEDLPVPNRIKTYLNTPFYYSEQVIENLKIVFFYPVRSWYRYVIVLSVVIVNVFNCRYWEHTKKHNFLELMNYKGNGMVPVMNKTKAAFDIPVPVLY
jgi:hypothetical protein